MGIVKIGQASIDENGRARGGAAGDQTTKEVAVGKWYTADWKYIFRAKDAKLASKIAKCMELACANDNIGYDQAQRTTLYSELENVGWDFSKIKTKCETDCSALVAAILNACGLRVSKDMYTGNEKNVIEKTGKFDIIEDPRFLRTSNYLMRGDILLKPGHTVVVLSNGDLVIDRIAEKKKEDNSKATKLYPKYTGTSQSIAPALYEVGERNVSLAHRKKIAVANGLCKTEDEWTGTAAQNTKMLASLKSGTLKKA